jgi:cell wall-associated NlpC family hydrolase
MHLPPLRRLVVLCVLAALLGGGATVLGAVGHADADLGGKISTASGRAEALRAAVAAETRKIQSSGRGLARAQARLRALQAQTAAEQAKLKAVEDALARARDRLTRLISRQHQATDALRANLVTAYRNPAPDIVSVIISAHGFSDLLEKADFLKRIGQQNARIMDNARTTRVAVTQQASRLSEIQASQHDITVRLERRRDSARTVESALLNERARRLAGRDIKRAELQTIQSQLATLRKKLARTARAGIQTNAGGTAQPPPGAPAAVGLVMAAGNAIAGLPYLYGGGHAGFKDTAYDCSGSVSYALAAAGLVSAPMASGPFMTWGEAGPGQWITVYANAGHAFMIVAGWRFDTSALSGGGTRWTRDTRSVAGFVARHPPGL